MLVHTDGRFSDIFGRKASLCLAMSIFMLGSILAGFSRTIVQLIVFRGLAGAGGGAIISVGQIVISDVVSLRMPSSQREDQAFFKPLYASSLALHICW